MTYDELTEYIKEYLECTETTFVANIPMFIKLAEEDIYRSVQLPDLRKNSTTSFTTSSPYLQTPSDYLSTYSMAVKDNSVYYYMENKDVNFIKEVFPDETVEGRPRYFAQFDDDTFIVGPTPDSAYTVQLHYFSKPASLADGAGSGTTWLSSNAEKALLYGSIIHGYVFLKGDQDVMQQYIQSYTKAVDDLKILSEGRVVKDTYREPNRRLRL